MKPEIIFITDVSQTSSVQTSRYIGPYVLKTRLEENGYSTLVIDKLLEFKNDDFFSYLTNFLSKDIKIIGISSTFLTKDLFWDYTIKNPLRTERAKNYVSSHLWFHEKDDLNVWLKKLKDLIKLYNPDCKLVLGGAKTSHIWSKDKDLVSPYYHFDYIIQGPAEISLLALLKNDVKYVEHNGNKFINSGSIFDYSQCLDTNWSKQGIQFEEALPLEIARGCVFNCKFCHYDKRQSIRKDVNVLRNELIRNYQEHGTRFYHFSDDCFNDSTKKVEEICQMIIDLPFKIEWVSYARMDLGVKFPHTFKLMVDSGMKAMFVGLESFNYKAAKLAGKGVPPEKIKQSLKEFRKLYPDVLIQGSFIVGLPEETKESQLETIDYLIDNDILDFASFGVLGFFDYHEELDMNTIDYPDYARHPEKYGFETITANPLYWKHKTMDMTEAEEIAEYCQKKWNDKKKLPFLKWIWSYPFLRGLGYTQSQILDMSRTEYSYNKYLNDYNKKYEIYLNKYWIQIINDNEG